MKKKFLVSILISNYNKKKFLQKNLKSCVTQSYKNKEIIIYDDCSIDGSIKVIKKFKKIKLIKGKVKKFNSSPLNQINALLSCFKLSKGKLIFLLDSDDYFKKNKLEYMVKRFKDDKNLMFLQDTPFFSEKNQIYSLKKKNNFFSIWPKFYPTSTIVVKREFFINFIKYIQSKSFPNLEIDARLSIYAFLKKRLNSTNKRLTIYNNDPTGISSYYKKFSKKWWAKRLEAYYFMFFLMKRFDLSIRIGPDYLITKMINKIL